MLGCDAFSLFSLLAAGGYASAQLIMHHQHNCVDNKTGSYFSRKVSVPVIHDASTLKGNTAMRMKVGQLYWQRVNGGTTLHRQLDDSLFDIEYDYNITMTESLQILGCVDLSVLGESGSQLDEDLRSAEEAKAQALKAFEHRERWMAVVKIAVAAFCSLAGTFRPKFKFMLKTKNDLHCYITRHCPSMASPQLSQILLSIRVSISLRVSYLIPVNYHSEDS